MAAALHDARVLQVSQGVRFTQRLAERLGVGGPCCSFDRDDGVVAESHQHKRLTRVFEDDRVGVRVVAAPVGPDARLPAQVPYLELDILVLQRLDVETDRRDRLYVVVTLIL